MAATFKDIIKHLNKEFPIIHDEISIKNCEDSNIGFNKASINQFVLGVTRGDPFSASIYHYETQMKDKLEGVSAQVNCIGWSYEGQEIQEMKSVLSDLAEHYSVKMDVDKAIKDLQAPADESRRHFIVVTVVTYFIAYVDQDI